MNQFLTREEVTELTGYANRVGQKKVLRENHISFTVRKDGWPMVTWYQVNHPNLYDEAHSEDEPDFSSLEMA